MVLLCAWNRVLCGDWSRKYTFVMCARVSQQRYSYRYRKSRKKKYPHPLGSPVAALRRARPPPSDVGRAPRSCCTRAPPANHPRARRAAERSNGRHAVRKSSFRPCSTTWHTIFLLRGGGAAGSPHRPAPAVPPRAFADSESRVRDIRTMLHAPVTPDTSVVWRHARRLHELGLFPFSPHSKPNIGFIAETDLT